MFSALGHFPPSQYRLSAHPVSESLGYDRTTVYQAPHVVGQNRFKYFRRPIVPYVSTFAGQVVYARRAAQALVPTVARAASPFQKTVSVQTIYRCVCVSKYS